LTNVYMKTIFAKHSGRFARLLSVAVLTLGVRAAQAVIIPASPVGQWDCVISGAGQNGIIFLNFTEDADPNSGFPTFEGLWIQAGHQGQTPATSRGGGGIGRNGSGGTTTFTNIFGGAFIHGSAGEVADNGGPGDWLPDSRGRRGDWFFNSKGQLVGSFYQVVNASATVTNFFETCTTTNFGIPLTNGGTFPFSFDICFTNDVLVTNVFWGPAEDGESGFANLTFVNTNFTLGLIGGTNNVSFVGKVVPNKHISLIGTTIWGKITITGVPLTPITTVLPVDAGYSWTGIKRQDGNQIAEQFRLIDTAIPNVFMMSGQGPSYAFGTNSFCMISANKKIGFAVDEVPLLGSSDAIVLGRATVGKFVNSRRAIGGKTVGDTTVNLNVIDFDAFLTPFIP
jgi:hypothetical protein